MIYDRGSQILLLKKEFPKLHGSGFRPTLFSIPVSSFFGRSNCILEITIPREYPVKRVSFKMINPIPHKWSDGDVITCPRDLYDKPLVDIVWEVVSKFNDYDIYVSGKRLHEDDKSTEPKYVESFTRLHQDVVHALNDPPISSQRHIDSLSEEMLRKTLESDAEIYKLIYKCETLSGLVRETKNRLNKTEEMILNSIKNLRKTENTFSDLKENVEYIEKLTNKSVFKFKLQPKESVKGAINREIDSLKNKISRRKEYVRSGKRRYKEVKDEMFNLYKSLNTLYTFYISIENN